MSRNGKAVKYSVHNDGYEVDQSIEFRNKGFSPDGKVTIHLNGIVNNELPEKEQPVDILESAEEDRGGWGNKFEFVLAIIGFAVGLGNVWRFPYLAQKNGGGAFIIPYAISLVLMGIPVFLLELSIGQRLRRGPLHVWNKLAPKLTDLPYAKCPTVGGNETYPIFNEECAKSSATTFYWYRQALTATDSIEESGGLNWKLSLCLLLAWALVFGITAKGAESMGKVVYFTALFPYVVLIIFFVRAMMLEGSADGIIHMFTPQFEKLKEPETWLDASTQIFYSLGLAFGGLISMSSYNPVNNNVVRDAILVSCVNCGTSIFAGIVIFGILGYKANVNYKLCLSDPLTYSKENGTCSKEYFLNQVAEGPGLTFIAFTEAISTMSVPQLWSVMFFMMLLTLGIGSMLGTYEAVRTTVVDLKLLPFRKEIVSLILCTISFGFGLLFCQRSGEYWLQMFDSFSANIGLLTIAFFECIIIMYIYGFENFADDFEFMLGKRPNIFWKVSWMFVTPFLVFVIIIASFYGLFTKSITYDAWNKELGKVNKLNYPGWGVALCFILVVLSVIFIPVAAVFVHFGFLKITDGDAEDKPDNVKKSSSKY